MNRMNRYEPLGRPSSVGLLLYRNSLKTLSSDLAVQEVQAVQAVRVRKGKKRVGIIERQQLTVDQLNEGDAPIAKSALELLQAVYRNRHHV